VWLNNRMLEGTRTVDGLEVADSKRAPGAANVTVRVPQAGRSVDLRVGQRLDVTSGKVQERYQVAPMTSPSSSSSETASTESASPPRSPLRRPSRERELRDQNRDIEAAPVERSEPREAGKG
jgi:heme-binding NEAT domain protein